MTLLIKVPATVTFYRGHRRTLCCLPGIISLIIMCVGIIFTNYLYVGGRALPRPRLELNLEPTAHSVRHTLLHMAPKWSSHRTTRAGLWGPISPSKKRGRQQLPTFRLIYCGQTAGWIKMPLDMEVGLGPGHTVLDGDPSPPKGHGPQFSAHVCCGQTAGWIKMPLGTKVGVGPGDIVLDGNPAPPPPKRGTAPPLFGPCLSWPNGWMDQDATWYGGRPRPRPRCVR